MTAVGIVGAGRAGVGLALALGGAGHDVRLHGRRGKQLPPPLRASWGGDPPWLAAVDVVVLAVRDDAVADAALRLASLGAIEPRHVVLHLSGRLDETVLDPLRASGAALGALHPLQAIARPEAAPERLRGALAVLSGDDRAVRTASELARSVGLVPVTLPGAGKPRYHAAAAIASNYLVVLAAIAERLMVEAGLTPDAAHRGVHALMSGTLANVADEGGAALTGPIARGDVATVRAHLAVLPPSLREAYRALGKVALEMTKLEPERRAAVEAELSAAVQFPNQ